MVQRGRFYNHKFHKYAAIFANVVLYTTQFVELFLFVYESSQPDTADISVHIRDIIAHLIMGSFALLLGIGINMFLVILQSAFMIYSWRLNKLLGNSMFHKGRRLVTILKFET
jgi:hypothetical protein